MEGHLKNLEDAANSADRGLVSLTETYLKMASRYGEVPDEQVQRLLDIAKANYRNYAVRHFRYALEVVSDILNSDDHAGLNVVVKMLEPHKKDFADAYSDFIVKAAEKTVLPYANSEAQANAKVIGLDMIDGGLVSRI